MCSACNRPAHKSLRPCSRVTYSHVTFQASLSAFRAGAVTPTCSSKARSATGSSPQSPSLSLRSEAFPCHNTCLSNYSTHSPGRRGEKEGSGERESNSKWSDQGGSWPGICWPGSGRECVEVKHNSHNPFYEKKRERRDGGGLKMGEKRKEERGELETKRTELQ